MELEGRAYRINTDFRACLAYQTALLSGEPIPVDRLLRVFFPGQEPPEAAAKAAISDFLRCGEKVPESAGEEEPPSPKALPYGYLTDAGALTAEFQRVYHLDLTAVEMHWWRFRALLRGLLEHSFSERVKFRTCTPGNIKNKELRKEWAAMKERYALDDRGLPLRRPRTLEEYNEMMLSRARGERW